MTPPKVTLLIPCYNAAAFLPNLLFQVKAMSEPFTTVLAYDDGSTDDTVAVAQSLGINILTPNCNGGVAHARNQLVAAAKTEWIHFHDADDRIHPDFIAKLGPLATNCHDVVSCDADWIYESDESLEIAWRYDPKELSDDPFPHLLRHAMGLNNSLIRRSTWDKVQGCDESLAIWEDADVHIRMARAGARWAHVAEVLTWSLRRSESFSHDYLKGWRCRLKALKDYATHQSVKEVSPILAWEAEKAAAELISLGDRGSALDAIALCRTLGGNPPTSQNTLIRLLRHFVPAVSLLHWQHRRRTSSRAKQ